MSKKFLYVAGILLTIIVGTVLFRNYCCDTEGRSSDTAALDSDVSMVPGEQVTEPLPAAPDSTPAIDWLAIRDQLNDNPLTPSFEPYQTERILSQDDMDKMDAIRDYLQNNPEGSILVTGHTDISGPRELNMKLSRERAVFLKNVLVQHGIEAEKITTDYKGPDEPVADNSSPEGRATNRRAEVIIK